MSRRRRRRAVSAPEEFGYPGRRSKPANLLEHILPHLNRDYEQTSNRQQLLRAAFDLMSCHSGAVYFDGWQPPFVLRRVV
jgi:hypothetical protein